MCIINYKWKKKRVQVNVDFFQEYNQLKRDIIRNHDDFRWVSIKNNQQMLPLIECIN
jgi:hypothetical protein